MYNQIEGSVELNNRGQLLITAMFKHDDYSAPSHYVAVIVTPTEDSYLIEFVPGDPIEVTDISDACYYVINSLKELYQVDDGWDITVEECLNEAWVSPRVAKTVIDATIESSLDS